MFDHYWNLQISVKDHGQIQTTDYQLSSFASCLCFISTQENELVSVSIEKVML